MKKMKYLTFILLIWLDNKKVKYYQMNGKFVLTYDREVFPMNFAFTLGQRQSQDVQSCWKP